MIARFNAKFNVVKFDQEKDRLSFRYGIIKQGDVEVFESTSVIKGDYLSRTIRDTLLMLGKYNSKSDICEMNFDSKSASKIQLLKFEEPMKAVVAGSKVGDEFKNLSHGTGDKVFIVVSHVAIDSGEENEYIFIYSKSDVGVVRDRRIQVISDDLVELSLKNTLVIDPSHLVSIHDVHDELLAIKDVVRAEVHHNLQEFFLLKAKEILSETVINSKNLDLNKSKVNVILKNEQYFKRDFINSHLDTLRDTLDKLELTILEMEEGIMTEPSIVFQNSKQLSDYIDLMSQYITRHVLEHPEEEKLIKNA